MIWRCCDQLQSPDLRDLVAPEAVFEKTRFSCAREPAIAAAAPDPQWVVCGAETHVCVLQTALELVAAGGAVFVVADACASRRSQDYEAAIHRLRQAGVQAVTTEMVIFEWLADARHPAFRALSQLIR